MHFSRFLPQHHWTCDAVKTVNQVYLKANILLVACRAWERISKLQEELHRAKVGSSLEPAGGQCSDDALAAQTANSQVRKCITQ